jgi:hypothetical protein
LPWDPIFREPAAKAVGKTIRQLQAFDCVDAGLVEARCHRNIDVRDGE